MNYEFFSCGVNNPLKFTDPSGYLQSYYDPSSGSFVQSGSGNNADGGWNFHNSLDQFYGRGQYALDNFSPVDNVTVFKNQINDFIESKGINGIWITKYRLVLAAPYYSELVGTSIMTNTFFLASPLTKIPEFYPHFIELSPRSNTLNHKNYSHQNGTLRENKLGFFGTIKEFTNSPSNTPDEFLAKQAINMIYTIADDLAVYASSLYYGPSKARHLSGGLANRNELEKAGINTITNFFSLSKLGKSMGISKNPTDIVGFRQLNKNETFFRGMSHSNFGLHCRSYNFSIRQNNQFNLSYNVFNYSLIGTSYIFNDISWQY